MKAAADFALCGRTPKTAAESLTLPPPPAAMPRRSARLSWRPTGLSVSSVMGLPTRWGKPEWLA